MVSKTGFIGLGIMGQPMAANLLKAGYMVVLYNRTAGKSSKLVASGAEQASCPRQVLEKTDFVILMLTGPEAIDSVLDGADGLFAGTCNGKTIINMSTVPVGYARELDARIRQSGGTFIDAPVSGSRRPAEQGSLVILAGGVQKKIEDLQPLFLAMGKKVVYCGEAGQGSAMKMAINLLLGLMTAGLCEAVNLGKKNGLDHELILQTIQDGPLGCSLFELKKDMLKECRYPVQFPLKHMLKDIRFVYQTATETGAALPLGLTLLELYSRGNDMGYGEMDFSAVNEVIAAMSD